MKMKTVLVLAFAVSCGLIAMMGVQQMISQQSNPNSEMPISVLVATTDISPGVLLNASNSEFKEFPAKGVPADAVRNKEQFHERGLLVPVMEGDIIRMTKLGARGDIAASASIPTGMRTVSIQVNDTKTHSGLLQPGDRVDLQVTFDVRSAEGNLVTKTATLLEYIEVFASDAFRNMEAGESKEIKAKNISLLVTPEQASYIYLAGKRGEIAPIMRNKTDKTLVNSDGVDKNLLAELSSGFESNSQNLPSQTEPVVELPKPQPQRDLKAYLDQMALAAQQAQPIPQVEQPEAETWRMYIYAGDQVATHSLTLATPADSEHPQYYTTVTPGQFTPQPQQSQLPPANSSTTSNPTPSQPEPLGMSPEQAPLGPAQPEQQTLLPSGMMQPLQNWLKSRPGAVPARPNNLDDQQWEREVDERQQPATSSRDAAI